MSQDLLQGFRLSFQQERAVRSGYGPGGDLPYRAVAVVRVDGALDAERLAGALRTVVAEHEILRTSLGRLGGMEMPLQVIDEPGEPTLRRHELTGGTAEAGEAEVERLAGDAFRGALDPGDGACLSVDWAVLAAERHALVLSLPVPCADAATLGLLIRGLADAYRGDDGTEASQYVDIAEWNNELLESPEAQEGRRFWQRFAGLPRDAGLLLAGRLPEGRPFAPERVAVPLASGARDRHFLLAVWRLLVRRVTGETPVLGVSLSGRRYEELADVLGPLARVVPLAGEVAADEPLAAAARRIGDEVAELETWQELFTWEALEDDGPRAFPYAFEHRDLPGALEAGPVRFEIEDARVCAEPFRLRLVTIEQGGELRAELHYDAGQVDAARAERLAGWIAALAASAAESPEAPAGALGLVGEDERRRILEELRSPAPAPDRRRTLVDLFQARADADPAAVALVWAGGELTFAELDERASRLARRLRALGVGPEIPVALCLDRSPEMVVAILGVLEAGGAYVPLDPGHPAERLAGMLADSGAPVLVTTESRLARFDASPVRILCLDRDADDIALEEAARLPAQAGPESLAYVIFTSGSTGHPKGVMVSHGAIVNRLLWMERTFPWSADDAVLQKTPYSFDASIWEIFLPLTTGARLVLAEPGGHRDSAYLARAVADHGVTVLQLVPSQLGVFLDQPEAADAGRALHRLFCGGEALPAELAARAATELEVEVVNLYGPTEVAIDATFRPCESRTETGVAPIGRPLDGVSALVLDERLDLAGRGLPGDLHVAGAGLARGYLGRPGLTAESFVPDAYADSAGARLYRTGDRARQRPDGELEFLGRQDHQIKLRGFRIELGEIEATLASHPDVVEAAVVAREDAAGNLRLLAYAVTGAGGSEPGERHAQAGAHSAALQDFLAARLPDYMVPAALVLLDRLPRLASGKLDRAALPAPETLEAPAERPWSPPRTTTEEILAGLWSSLLGIDRIGIHDSFFELGGHSLLATQLVARVRKLLRLELPVRALFEDPTLEALARRVDAAQRGAAGLEDAIEPRSGDAEPGLSFAQQRLWFLDQLNPGSPAYNLPTSVRLEGSLSMAVLVQSLHEIERRHETLRTAFPLVDGQPVQRIAPEPVVRVPLVDLRGLAEPDREAEAARLAAEVSWRSFDLAAGPLLRAALLRLAAEDHGGVFSMHHSIGDGWSTVILVRELAALVQAFEAGEPSLLPELPVQYADYAEWERRQMTGERFERRLGYWREQLGGELPALRLPFDRPRSAAGPARPRTWATRIPEPVADGLRRLAREQGASLFMVLLAAFEALLFRYTGQRDITVGVPIANRSRSEIEGLIGFFANSLALRTRVGDGATLEELLATVREVTLGAYAHQEVPFERLVEALHPERSAERLPLFQIMFMLQNLPQESFESPGMTVRPQALRSRAAKFDLLTEIRETPEGLSFGFEYRADLFDATTVNRLGLHYGNLLAAFADDLGTTVAAAPMLTAGERQQLVREWNDTDTERPEDVAIHELFEAQAARRPDHPAVAFDGGEWSYREVSERADRLVHHLRSLGVGPGRLVGIYLDRCPEMVPALLAVLRSGGAYVPLDPSHPLPRVRGLLETMEIGVVLTRASLWDAVDAEAGLPRLEHVVCVAGEAPDAERYPARTTWAASRLDGAPAEASAPRVTGDDLAYVIFTSGSTGVPKGVMVRHRPVVNLFRWLNRRFEVGPDDRLLFVTSLCFDLSVYDVFGILAAGGTVRLASDAETADPERLVGILCEEPITFWDTAPAALRQLVPFFPEAGGAGASASLARVFLSGDWIPLGLPGAVRSAFPGARVVALGGATEATVWSNYFPVGAIDPAWVSVPYGRPIENARYHVLDDSFRPCAIDVEGDLYIGGGCLFSGYAGDARLSSVKLLPDPFGEEPGGRLYRTGDRARLRSDGNIEFLGRVDHQVKIRGYRIELGEVEATLLRHPDVREAVVLAREDGRGEKRLVAYLIPEAGRAPADGALRTYVRGQLPDYMTPAAFVLLDALPVTANGKLDRDALPDPEAPGSGRETPRVAPRNRAEEILVGIWRDLLGIEEIGITDNFFELGGDSILSIQIVTRARQEGLDLDPRDLFDHQTVEELAAAAGQAPDRPAAEEGPVVGPAALTPVQHWLLEQELPDLHHFNQALMLEVGERIDGALLERAAARVTEHHDQLRARFSRGDDGWRQVIAEPGDDRTLVVLDLSGLPAAARKESLEGVAAGLQRSFDLASGPLFRLALFDLGPGEPQRLLALAHHLVIDGVSWRILLEDLWTAYRELAAGRPAALPPKGASYARWSEALRREAASPEVAAELAYWAADERRELTPLPRDLESGTNDRASSREMTVSLDAEETRALLREVPRAYNTRIDDALLTALAGAFAGWTGERRLLVDLEGHGRGEPAEGLDPSRTVGWFTAIHPVLVDLGDRAQVGAEAGAELRSVKEGLRRVPRDGRGWGVLRYLADRDTRERLAALPGAEVAFNYLGRIDAGTGGDAPWRGASESAGPPQSRRQPREHLFEVTARVVEGRLLTTWTFSRAVHRAATVEELAERFAGALRGLIEHCRSVAVPGHTPSDFPLVDLDQGTLDRLTAAGPIEDVYPLSPLQQGILFHALDEPGTGAYMLQLHTTLDGEVDRGALVAAWQRVVDRHPTLRTAFLWEDLAEPIQVVRAHVGVEIETLDWSGLDDAERERRIAGFLAEDRGRDFLLADPPLMRLALVRVGEASHRLVWTVHHLVVDGWSLPLLLQEVMTFYEGIRAGEEPVLPVPRPYRDYVAWLGRQDRGAAEAFWRRRLAGFTRATPLPPGPAAGDLDGADPYQEIHLHLSTDASERLRSWARRHQLTLATAVQGAWALVTGQAAGERDVAFGVVSAGRPAALAGIEEMIGMFVNTLPMRVRLPEERELVSWLKEVQAEQLEMREYEHCPLVEIHGWSEVPPREPLFESLLIFESRMLDDILDETPSEVGVHDTETAIHESYPLVAVVLPKAELSVGVRFDRRRLSRASAERLSRRFTDLLEGLPAGSGKSLVELSAGLEASERRREEREDQDLEAAGIERLRRIRRQATGSSSP